MGRFVEGEDRSQSTLLPERLDDYVTEDNPVRVVDEFVDNLDLATLGFDRAIAQATGRPGYHPATLLKIYIYGYLNRVQSSRRLEREAQRARRSREAWQRGSRFDPSPRRWGGRHRPSVGSRGVTRAG